MLISDIYNENEVNMKRIRVIVRATHCEFRRTEGELVLKNICKTLQST